jgi:hypothetical protein
MAPANVGNGPDRRRTRMRFVAVALTAAALAAPALAQDAAGSNKHHGAPSKKSEAPTVKADDKDYKAALDRLPAQKYDPWRTTRPADDKH